MNRRTLLLGLIAAFVAPWSTTRAAVGSSGERLLAAARRQKGVTKGYDPAYVVLAYPGGDLPRRTGVCADVIIRAARDGLGLDLQKLVHEDMVRAFSAYPRRWGLKKPDPNIDHRRVPNLETYWRRCGAQLWRSTRFALSTGFPKPLQSGDILTWNSWWNRPHVGIVSQVRPHVRVVHNIGSGVKEQALWTLITLKASGHYRWPRA